MTKLEREKKMNRETAGWRERVCEEFCCSRTEFTSGKKFLKNWNSDF